MRSRILIVGAGIAGLSLAQRLTRYGLDFDIIEKNSSETKCVTGAVLPFNAVRELKDLNVFDRLLNKFNQISEVTYSTMSGRTLGTASLADPPFENDQFITLKRQDLKGSLLEGLQKKVRYNTDLLSVEHGDNEVKITCSNELLNGTYDLVIAADGIDSAVRAQNYEGQQTIVDHDIVSWRFLISYPDHGLHPLHMIGHADLFMVYPVGPNALYCYGHIQEQNDLYSLTQDPKENLLRVFTSYGGAVPDILSRLDGVEIVTDRLKSVTEPIFFDRRIAFIGDAANGCSSLIQQGIATALEDSRCLADALAMQNIDQALQSYMERRQKVIAHVIKYSDDPVAQLRNMQRWSTRCIRYATIKTLGPPNVLGWRKLATGRHF
ncbi:MAG: FAD-dependent monooxygenase [Sneathiella sp.]|nr:FAD-dependent monooxygenase [Sneathiella sp.]